MSYKPHIVKLSKGGQATFVYMPQERAEAYERALLSVDGDQVNVDCNITAIGLCQNPESKRWELAVIKFNPLTKQAFVESVKEVSINKGTAAQHFKKAAIDLKIV
jgi:hypothetical protein